MMQADLQINEEVGRYGGDPRKKFCLFGYAYFPLSIFPKDYPLKCIIIVSFIFNIAFSFL